MISLTELYSLYKKSTGLTTDSRQVKDGMIFFALRGENFDGNDYAEAALKAGARYAVVDRVAMDGLSWRGRTCIMVENVLDMLQQLAAYHRRQYDIPVLGITGTNGKTTTKELISAVLGKKFRVVATQGNFNNHIGVPLTLLRIDDKTELAVVEMGASAPGEIAGLTQLVRPTCGLVTTVGKAHLQGFGSFEGVKKTKGELYDYLRQTGGMVFYDADNPDICEMVARRPGLCTRRYGVKEQGVRIAPATAEAPFLQLEYGPEDKPVKIATKLVGDYNAVNVMAALTIGEYFEVPARAAYLAVESYKPSNSRSQLVKTERNTLVVDAYNANPSSMRAALDNFASTDFPNKVLMLGDMLELGEDSAKEHLAILKKAKNVAPLVLVVGPTFSKVCDKIAHEQDRFVAFPDVEALKEYLAANPVEGSTILVKGSNGIHMQQLVDVL